MMAGTAIIYLRDEKNGSLEGVAGYGAMSQNAQDHSDPANRYE